MDRQTIKLGLQIIFELPATILHELSHALVGLLTLCKVRGVSVLPRVINGELVLGSVQVVPLVRVSLFFVGLAPLLLITLAVYMIYNKVVVVNEVVSVVLYLYLFKAGIPSLHDVKVAFKSLFSTSGFLLITAISFLIGSGAWKSLPETFRLLVQAF